MRYLKNYYDFFINCTWLLIIYIFSNSFSYLIQFFWVKYDLQWSYFFLSNMSNFWRYPWAHLILVIFFSRLSFEDIYQQASFSFNFHIDRLLPYSKLYKKYNTSSLKKLESREEHFWSFFCEIFQELFSLSEDMSFDDRLQFINKLAY